MADNATLPATGSIVAANDIGAGVLVQRVKPVWGAPGTGTDTQVAQPLPVQASAESSQMTMLGTVVTPQYAIINTSSTGNTTLVAAVAAKVTRVIAYALVCDGTVAVKFTSGAGGTNLTGAMSFVANGGVTTQCDKGLFQTATNTDLVLNLSGAVGVRGHLTYIQG